jgi:2-polyprenyl-3-methyl-5-hydroxy-6-metoxy-1,4-benzoquinol methylase
MPLLSDFARKKKINYFIKDIPKDKRILEIGGGSGWAGKYLTENGWTDYTSIDVVPPAGIIGDIRQWQSLGLKENSFDIIIGFEVVEHVDCFKDCWALLKPGGKFLITTPVPHMDWFLHLLEHIGLNQKRTNAHDHLVYLKTVNDFQHKKIKIIAFLSQWGIFVK